ncbi:MAG TPA: hypothetical protein VLQ20_02935 [Planococcus sp. (in: firmicutes)]|nr:hypothetical protein [Planococcus sp. (in: firmicutes)]
MGLFRFLFLEKKYLVYTVFGHEMYNRAVRGFDAQGISDDAVRTMNDTSIGSAGQSDIPLVRNSSASKVQYDFYVKKEDQHRCHFN